MIAFDAVEPASGFPAVWRRRGRASRQCAPDFYSSHTCIYLSIMAYWVSTAGSLTESMTDCMSIGPRAPSAPLRGNKRQVHQTAMPTEAARCCPKRERDQMHRRRPSGPDAPCRHPSAPSRPDRPSAAARDACMSHPCPCLRRARQDLLAPRCRLEAQTVPLVVAVDEVRQCVLRSVSVAAPCSPRTGSSVNDGATVPKLHSNTMDPVGRVNGPASRRAQTVNVASQHQQMPAVHHGVRDLHHAHVVPAVVSIGHVELRGDVTSSLAGERAQPSVCGKYSEIRKGPEAAAPTDLGPSQYFNRHGLGVCLHECEHRAERAAAMAALSRSAAGCASPRESRARVAHMPRQLKYKFI